MVVSSLFDDSFVCFIVKYAMVCMNDNNYIWGEGGDGRMVGME
jgi:hypothetical protein